MQSIENKKEEIKLDLFIDDITVYVEDQKESTKKLPKIGRKCKRFQDKRAIQKLNGISVYEKKNGQLENKLYEVIFIIATERKKC